MSSFTPEQIDELAALVRRVTEPQATLIRQLQGGAESVDSLPSTAPHGTEVDYMPPGVTRWRMRYNANTASPYKWEFVDGPPVITVSSTTLSFGAAYTNDTAMNYTTPAAGEYDLEFEVQPVGNQADSYLLIQSTLAGVGFYNHYAYNRIAANYSVQATYLESRTATTAGQVLSLGYQWTNGGTSGEVRVRTLRIRPRRLA